MSKLRCSMECYLVITIVLVVCTVVCGYVRQILKNNYNNSINEMNPSKNGDSQDIRTESDFKSLEKWGKCYTIINMIFVSFICITLLYLLLILYTWFELKNKKYFNSLYNNADMLEYLMMVASLTVCVVIAVGQLDISNQLQTKNDIEKKAIYEKREMENKLYNAQLDGIKQQQEQQLFHDMQCDAIKMFKNEFNFIVFDFKNDALQLELLSDTDGLLQYNWDCAELTIPIGDQNYKLNNLNHKKDCKNDNILNFNFEINEEEYKRNILKLCNLRNFNGLKIEISFKNLTDITVFKTLKMIESQKNNSDTNNNWKFNINCIYECSCIYITNDEKLSAPLILNSISLSLPNENKVE